jgi:hypothetical protein
MLSSSEIEKIKSSTREHIIMCEGKDWTEAQYDEYFMTEYVPCQFWHYDDDNFFSYKVGEYIWIQDFVTTGNMRSVRMLDGILNLQYDHKKDIRCNVAITNIKILNALLRSDFRIVDMIGYNYVIESKYKQRHGN